MVSELMIERGNPGIENSKASAARSVRALFFGIASVVMLSTI
jgi:hypothetical protein